MVLVIGSSHRQNNKQMMTEDMMTPMAETMMRMTNQRLPRSDDGVPESLPLFRDGLVTFPGCVGLGSGGFG